MTNRKPIIQIVLTQKYYEKLIKLAEKEGRSNSNQGARMIEKAIDDYENQNGEI